MQKRTVKSRFRRAKSSLNWTKCGTLYAQKKQAMDLESLLSNHKNPYRLGTWRSKRRHVREALERLETFDVKIYFADNWDGYAWSIPPEKLIQTKAETHGIERNNSQQRHWFARFRRRTCVVSRSVEMVDLTTALFAWFHSKEGKRRLFDLRAS